MLADRYANSNVMREETIEGLKGRAKKFLENCLREDGGDADVYVSPFSAIFGESKVVTERG